MWSWAGLAGLLIGALSAGQSRMNGELSARLHEPLYAALWSFGSGWVVLTVVLLASRRTRAGLRALTATVRAGRMPVWQTLGGLLGGTYVLVQAYAVPLAGVALFTIAVVGGQTGNAIVVDRMGLGPAGRAAVTTVRVVAAVLATIGVGIAVWGRVLANSGPGGAGMTTAVGAAVVVPVLLALLVGGLHSVQSAINGRVNVATGTPWATTWLNFTNGVILLSTVVGIRWASGGLGPVRLDPPPGWVWFGGLAGVVFVGVAAVVVRHLGVLHTMLVLLCGQVLGALTLDLLNPATRHTVTLVVLAGLGLTAVAAVLPALRRRAVAGLGA
ncbi:MAG: DMT family transporter [Actinomycetales bacterium]|nr:DMT family transporter [Actinomycetales bacterium]